MIATSDTIGFLCCPHCQDNFQASEGGLKCLGCGCEFVVDHGIPRLVTDKLGNDALTTPYRELHQRVAEIGWKDAVAEHVETLRDNTTIEHISSEAQADFRFLMPLDRDSVVLDIGSRGGSIATALARVSQHVIALDADLDNLRLVQLRTQQEGLSNVTVVQGDTLNLSIQPQSCDGVVMVGVLEQLARGRSNEQPHHLQKQALEKVYHALKPGGCLYLATANRFSVKNFLGSREPNTNLRFVSLLPHKLAQAYSRKVRGQDYREITYSLRGLQKLMYSVGFDQVDLFFPIPHYQNFRFLMNLGDKNDLRFILDHLQTHPRFTRFHYLSGRAILYSPLIVPLARYFWPTFSVLATRS